MRKLITSTFLMVSFLLSNAQIISGIVKDSITREPLIGASVFIIEAQKGNFTDEKGNFSIEVHEKREYRIMVSYVGYETKVRKLDMKSIWQGGFREFRLEPVSVTQSEIIITGTKMETNKGSVPLTTSVITSTQLDQTTEMNVLPLISQKVPGVFVTQRGFAGFGIATGAAGKISVRGVGSGDQSQLLVLIDGQPQVMGIFGHAFADMYNTSDYTKVEIIRGPGSVLYGSNAMGGVVNLITKKKSADGLSFDATAQYGSFNTIRGTVKTGYQKNKFSVWGTYNQEQSKGYRPSSQYANTSGHLGLNYKINQHFNARLTGNISSFYAADPGPISDSLSAFDDVRWADVNRVNSMFTLNNRFEKANGRFNLFYNQGDHEIYTTWVSRDRNWGATIFEEFQISDRTKLSVGVDFNQYGGRGSVNASIDSLSYFGVSETSAYAILQQKLGRKFVLNGGARLANHSVYGTQLIPQLGATFQLNPNNDFKAMASKGYRSPNVKELYFFPVSNTELQPEGMWNYEIGYRRKLLNKHLITAVTAYYIQGDNIIQIVPTGTMPPFKYSNTGAFTHKGVEVEVQYRIKPNVSLDANYSYLNMDTPKLASPEQMAQVGISYVLKRFDLNGSVQYVNGLYTRLDDVATTTFDESSTENYVLANAKVNFRISQQWSAFVSGNNLLNQAYEIMYDYPMPGITFMTGIRFQLNY